MKVTHLAVAATVLALDLYGAAATETDRAWMDGFAIDRAEVTIGEFRAFRDQYGKTAAEREGGGHEFDGGWVKRQGWIWAAPSGIAEDDQAPVVQVSWEEAMAFCANRGGRLPTRSEWNRAAYEEMRPSPGDGFTTGRTYPFPVGDQSAGMNTSGDDPWPRAAPTQTTKRGVNGLYDMGGNVWEWLFDRRGDDALTAGGSWWYGADKAMRSSAQWKPANFYAVYIGFRCTYDRAN